MKNPFPNFHWPRFFVGAMVLLAVCAPQAGADGTRGGGQTVNKNGRPVLRDLVDTSNCRFITSSEFAKKLPEFAAMLSSIESVHWYLRYNIEKQMKSLSICQTRAPLAPVPVEDQDAVALVSNPDGRQVGVWSGDQIFLDMSLFEQLSEIDQAYTLLHEIMHTLVPMNVSMRNTRLRSFVKTVRDNQQSPMSFDEFAMQMRANYISVPANTPLVTDPAMKGVFMKMINPETAEIERMIAAGKLRKIWDQMVNDDTELVQKIMMDGDLALLTLVKANNLKSVQEFLEASYASDQFYTNNEMFFRDPHFDLKSAHTPVFNIASADHVLWLYLMEQTQYPLLLYPLLYGETATVKLLLDHASPLMLSRWINYGFKSGYMTKGGVKKGGSEGVKELTLVAIANFLNHPEISELLEAIGGRAEEDPPFGPLPRRCAQGPNQSWFAPPVAPQKCP